MAVDLICPDCGGIIGGTDGDENGRGPCTCLESDSDVAPAGKSDTVTIPAPPPPPASETAGVHTAVETDAAAKVCIACGKDVSGHRRTKDSRGYLCLACAKAEIEQKKEGTVPCSQCGRRIKPAGLVHYRGEKICKLCFTAHKEAEKKIIKSVPDKHYQEHEKQKLLILGGVFLVLLLIVILRWFLL
jgi:hypothetical protein